MGLQLRLFHILHLSRPVPSERKTRKGMNPAPSSLGSGGRQLLGPLLAELLNVLVRPIKDAGSIEAAAQVHLFSHGAIALSLAHRILGNSS